MYIAKGWPIEGRIPSDSVLNQRHALITSCEMGFTIPFWARLAYREIFLLYSFFKHVSIVIFNILGKILNC